MYTEGVRRDAEGLDARAPEAFHHQPCHLPNRVSVAYVIVYQAPTSSYISLLSKLYMYGSSYLPLMTSLLSLLYTCVSSYMSLLSMLFTYVTPRVLMPALPRPSATSSVACRIVGFRKPTPSQKPSSMVNYHKLKC